MYRGILLVILAFAFGCSSTPKKSETAFNSETLKELGITQRPEAPKIPFEEFYKTSGLSSFDFSPDGKKVYFLKSDGKVRNIFAYDIPTKKMTQVTKYPEAVNTFKVSPDGKYLYVQKDVGGSEVFDLYRFDLKTSATKQLTFGKNIERSYLCDIDKKGTRLYFSQSQNKRAVYDVKYLDLKTLKPTLLVAGGEKQLYCDALSANGDKLLFQSFINNNERHVGFIDTKSGKAQYFLAEAGVNVGSMFFVGDSVLFSSTKDSDIFRIWKYNVPSAKLDLVKTGLDNDIQSLSIFGDGKVTVLNYRGRLAPQTKAYDGVFASEKKLELPGELASATFSNYDPTLGIVVVENAHTPAQFFIVQKGELTRFYDSNQSTIDGNYFSKAYSTFVTSFDGLQVPAHFIIPNGTSAAKKRPAIVWVHGGPEDHVDPVYSGLQQFMVNNGFVLIAPNVRGSTGFGKAYQFKDNGDWGGGHIKDLVAVANYAKTLDFIDKDNVFLIGGSFGGFSVMSLVTQYPTVFKAAVDIFGPVEMSKFVGSWPPIAQTYWIGEIGGDPRSDDSLNKRLSPLYHVDKIKIPIQVHQGATDIRIPKEQSDLLVEKMKEKGIAVDYHVYPDEGHGFLKFDNTKKCFSSVVDFYKSKM
ncbi:MAG: S9 family peptidase [Bdellovibrionaceae bacterium]|nr:S9 family peptidase [Pseudobdellovibrionaceae bacterium]